MVTTVDPTAAAMLRSVGLRVTAPRLSTLSVLAEHPHSDAESVARHLRGTLGSVSTQAVYDVLRALSERGLVRRIEPAGSSALFELRVGDNHHHVVCRRCGDVRDVACAVGSAPCLEAEDDHGFVVDEAEVIYWGTCPSCLAATGTAGHDQPRPRAHTPAPHQTETAPRKGHR